MLSLIMETLVLHYSSAGNSQCYVLVMYTAEIIFECQTKNQNVVTESI